MDSSKNASFSTNEYTVLCDAIRNNEMATARQLLINNAPVNPSRRLYCADTPLHLAIKLDKEIDFIELLLNKGAIVDVKNYTWQTPLQIAVKNRNEYVFKLLIKRGALHSLNLNEFIFTLIEEWNIDMVQLVIETALKDNCSIDFTNAVYIAAKRVHYELVKYLLPYCEISKLKRLNIPSEVILSSLCEIACKDISDLLLQYGFVVSRTDKKNFSFVYAAVEKKCLNVVKDILAYGIDVNEIHGETGLTLLHVASVNNDLEMVQLLLNYKAKLNVKAVEVDMETEVSTIKSKERQFYGKTSLYISVYNSDVKITKLLLMNGADVTKEPHILITAIQKSNKEIIEILLNHGANLNVVNNAGETPLYCCIQKYFDLEAYIINQRYYWPFELHDDEIMSEIVELLLKHGANPNLNSIEGKVSVLQVAIAEGCLNVVRLLLKYNANINHSDIFHNTALHFATNGDPTIADLILECNPNINALNDRLMTPLHFAATKMNNILLKKLLKMNAYVNGIDKNGDTALHLACRKDYNSSTESVKVLLNYNADVNIKNRRGQSPLNIIVPSTPERTFTDPHENYEEYIYKMSEFLGSNKSYIDSPTLEELNILRTEKVEALLKHNVDIDSVDNIGRTLLANAYKNGDENIVSILLQHGANANFKYFNGKTLLHFAAANNGTYIFELLLTYGADVNIVCNKNKIALQCLQHKFNSEKDLTTLFHKVTVAKSHLMKLKCAKLKLNQANLIFLETPTFCSSGKKFTSNIDLLAIENKCYNEIEKLKSIKFSCITLYNFLTDNIHDISKFIKNDDIIQTVQTYGFIYMFPLYGAMIKNRFRQATKRHQLLEIVLKYFYIFIYKFPMSCMEHIFCYLDLRDLQALISVFQSAGSI